MRNTLEKRPDHPQFSPLDYLPVKLYIMKKLFLAGAIGISIAALAATHQPQKGSSLIQDNDHTLSAYQDTMLIQDNDHTLSAYQDTIPKRDTGRWPKDTLPRRDSINIQ
jgi:hypothetical protein